LLVDPVGIGGQPVDRQQRHQGRNHRQQAEERHTGGEQHDVVTLGLVLHADEHVLPAPDWDVDGRLGVATPVFGFVRVRDRSAWCDGAFSVVGFQLSVFAGRLWADGVRRIFRCVLARGGALWPCAATRSAEALARTGAVADARTLVSGRHARRSEPS
jgi:hypothetical protein